MRQERGERGDARRSIGRQGALAAASLGLGLVGREVVQRRREASLEGQTVLITGGSRGLGFVLAREFAREGCRVAICARDEAELERAREALAVGGAEVLTLPCDVADRAQVDRMVAEATGRLGAIDVLVANAGIIQVGPLQTMTVEDFETALGVMYWGVVYPTLAVLPAMRARRQGRIVTITSIGGKVSVPQLVPYSCAKFAAVGFSEGLRAELAGTGIKVTTIAPGLMRSGGHLNAYFKGEQEKMFALFAPVASLPGVSMDVERAAKEIVGAIKRGDAERILSAPASLLAAFHGLFPGATADLFGVVNRLLPTDGTRMTNARGMDLQERVQSPLFRALTRWGESAGRRFNAYPGPAPTIPHDERGAPPA